MLTASEVATRLGLRPRTVYELAARGLLACYRVGAGGGAVRFDPADVEAYRTSCRSAGTPATSAGATSSTVSLKAADTDLADYFRAARVKLKLTPTTGANRRGSTRLRLASSSETR